MSSPVPEAGERSDRDLLDRWVGGDRAALERLLQRWYEPCCRVAARIAPHEAADAVQEGFLAAMAAAASCRGEPGPWLVGVVANAARKLLRSGRRGIRGRTVPADAPVVATGGSAEPADADVLAVVRAVLGELPEHERLPLLMRFADGLQPAAIAAALGISGVAVRVRLHRGTRRMRALLARRGITAVASAAALPLPAVAIPPPAGIRELAQRGPPAGPAPAPAVAATAGLAAAAAVVAVALVLLARGTAGDHPHAGPATEQPPPAPPIGPAADAAVEPGATLALVRPFRFHGDGLGTAIAEIMRRLPDASPLRCAVAFPPPFEPQQYPGTDAWGRWTWTPPAGACRVDAALDRLAAAFGLGWELIDDTVVITRTPDPFARRAFLAQLAAWPDGDPGRQPRPTFFSSTSGEGGFAVLFPCRMCADPGPEDLAAGAADPDVWAAAATAALRPGAEPRARRTRSACLDRLPLNYFGEERRLGDAVVLVLQRHPELAVAAREALRRAATGGSGPDQLLIALRVVGARPQAGDAALIVRALTATAWDPVDAYALDQVAIGALARCRDPAAAGWLILQATRKRDDATALRRRLRGDGRTASASAASGGRADPTDGSELEWLPDNRALIAASRCWSPAVAGLVRAWTPPAAPADRDGGRLLPELAGSEEPVVLAAFAAAAAAGDAWVRAGAAVAMARTGSTRRAGVAACCALAGAADLELRARLNLVAEAARSAEQAELPRVVAALRPVYRLAGPVYPGVHVVWQGAQSEGLRFAAGVDPAAALLALLDDPATRDPLAEMAVASLVALRSDDADRGLAERWRRAGGERRRIIGTRLLANAGRELAPEIRHALGLPEPEPTPAAAVASAIAAAGPADAVDRLMGAPDARAIARDPARPPWLRGAIWLVAAEHSYGAGAADAAAAFADPDGYVRACAMWALVRSYHHRPDPEVAVLLDKGLADVDPRVRAYAALAAEEILGAEIAPDLAARILAQLSGDRSPLARRAAALAAWSLADRDPAARRALATAARGEADAWNRAFAASLLGSGEIRVRWQLPAAGHREAAAVRGQVGATTTWEIPLPAWTADPEEMPLPVGDS